MFTRELALLVLGRRMLQLLAGGGVSMGPRQRKLVNPTEPTEANESSQQPARIPRLDDQMWSHEQITEFSLVVFAVVCVLCRRMRKDGQDADWWKSEQRRVSEEADVDRSLDLQSVRWTPAFFGKDET